MSIVALKRKINAKKNISNTPITGLKVYNSAPGVNAKRGLVTRANGTVVNRNRRVLGRTYQAQEPNPYTIIVSSDTPSANNPVGFSINGTKNIKANVRSDSNLAYQYETPGCCSDNGTTIKRSVLGTKGMIDSKKYRNSNCCQKN